MFLFFLVLAPVIPLGVLIARDYGYALFGWENSETPQGSWLAWEIWLIAGVCWITAAALAIAHWAQRAKGTGHE